MAKYDPLKQRLREVDAGQTEVRMALSEVRELIAELPAYARTNPSQFWQNFADDAEDTTPQFKAWRDAGHPLEPRA